MRRVGVLFQVAVATAATALVGLEGAAYGAPQDAAALKVRDQAIYVDYLATNFTAAETKLSQAIAGCGDGDACSATVRARLQCDLGSVLFGDGKVDEAKAHFLLAAKEDPGVALEKDLSSPDMKRLFDAVKNAGQVPSGGAPASNAPPPADEDIKHAPPVEQATLTPVPLYAEIPDEVEPSRVIIRFNAPGMQQWKTAPMHKVGGGWGGEIPCADVGDSAGNLRYFIQATNAAGDLVAWSGRLVAPHVVHVVERIQTEAPHLPGEPPPARCAQKSDCPPGFPGCHDEGAKQACEADTDCTGTQACRDGYCEETAPPPPVDAPFKRNWLSVGFQADLLFLPSADDACAGGTGYTCFGNSGGYYGAIPLKGADDSINGGPAPSTMRILVGYDRALLANVTAGVRLGYAFNGGPQRPSASSFEPLHAEVRGQYWFGHNPLARAGFRFFALLAAGMAEVDGSIPVDVYSSPQAYMKGQSQSYVAWKKTGLGFGAAGGGAMLAVTPTSGVVLEAKFMELFPTASPAAGLQLAYAIGL
jgi:hypothetical protein